MNLITSEAVDIELHPSMNRRAVFSCAGHGTLSFTRWRNGRKACARIHASNIMGLFGGHRGRPSILLNFFCSPSSLFSLGCISCLLSSISFFIPPLVCFPSCLKFLPLFLWRFRHSHPPLTTRILLLICYYIMQHFSHTIHSSWPTLQAPPKHASIHDIVSQ